MKRFKKSLRNKNVLITAGPTREWMDPVRFLSNPSSGAMGIEIAKELHRRGVRVTLILGPTHLSTPSKIKTIHVSTAQQMFAAVKKYIAGKDAFISTAAVGDWTFKKTASRKMKKTSAKTMTLKLIKNPDILAWVGDSPHPNPLPKGRGERIVVGFALETEDLKQNALHKLKSKKLDLIIANSPETFSSVSIRPVWIEAEGLTRQLGKMSKRSLSQKIGEWLKRKWNEPNQPN